MPRDNRCLCMAHVCFYVCCSDCVWVCGNVCCLAAVIKDSIFSLWVLKYVVCLCKGCDGCCAFSLCCEVWSCRCSCMGSVSVSSCRCCMCVSCVILWQSPMQVLYDLLTFTTSSSPSRTLVLYNLEIIVKLSSIYVSMQIYSILIV